MHHTVGQQREAAFARNGQPCPRFDSERRVEEEVNILPRAQRRGEPLTQCTQRQRLGLLNRVAKQV